MSTPRAAIAYERRRQMQVRKAFQAGLEPAADWQGRSPADFYLACADYLFWSMDRLHEQDQWIHDFLAARIPPAEADAHQRLATLNARQQDSRRLVETLRRAAADLRASAGPGLPAFVASARQFNATFGSLLQPRKNPFSAHTDRLFSEADWVKIAGVTPASAAEEKELFARVQATAPRDVDPDRFVAQHMPG